MAAGWIALALISTPTLGSVGCGGPSAAPATPMVISNSADQDGPIRRATATDLELAGEWIDEVGTSFWFEQGDDGSVILTRAGRFDDPRTGTTDGEFWLSYSTGDDTTVTITLHEWDDDLGGYRCTWDNGESDGNGTLRPRARVEADGDLDDEGR